MGVLITRAVLAAVYFVDDDPERDAQAEAALRAPPRVPAQGRVPVRLIAAAFDHEQRSIARRRCWSPTSAAASRLLARASARRAR
jgi:hypothetical protein